MKTQFDSNQQYQLDAIQAMVEIFGGQLKPDTVLETKSHNIELRAV